MTPLIDVIFLLLTFFIYNLIVSVQAEVLPVKFTPVSSGQMAGQTDVKWLQIDKRGSLIFNKEAVTDAQLDAKLAALAKDPTFPTLYLVVEAAGETDRAPLLISLFERVKKAGIRNVAFVGQPEKKP